MFWFLQPLHQPFQSVTPYVAYRVGPPRSNRRATKMADHALKSLPKAMESLPVPRSRSTGLRWLRAYPGLGVTIGGRHFMHDAALKAIGQGVSLAEAARIGAGGERAAA